ncbi:unnamed protein product, partial [Prorocentrum cordatum]
MARHSHGGSWETCEGTCGKCRDSRVLSSRSRARSWRAASRCSQVHGREDERELEAEVSSGTMGALLDHRGAELPPAHGIVWPGSAGLLKLQEGGWAGHAMQMSFKRFWQHTRKSCHLGTVAIRRD